MLKFQTLQISCGTEEKAVSMINTLINACHTKSFFYCDRNKISPYPVEIVDVTLEGLPTAKLFFGQSWTDPSIVNVANIIPHGNRIFQLTREQYNAILKEFYKQIVLPNAPSAKLSDADVSLNNLIPKSAHYLENWFNGSNLGGRFSHDSDLSLWYKFVYSIIKNGEELGMDDLENWLISEKHIDEDTASEIIIRYGNDKGAMEFAVELLKSNRS